jgi:hypothetical protein
MLCDLIALGQCLLDCTARPRYHKFGGQNALLSRLERVGAVETLEEDLGGCAAEQFGRLADDGGTGAHHFCHVESAMSKSSKPTSASFSGG